MQRFSIARSLRLALIALTFVLALVAAVGVSSLYHARQTYENELVRASQLATAAANLTSAGVAEAEVWRDVRGADAPAARRQVEAAYQQTAAQALSLARDDPASAALVRAEISAQAKARTLANAGKPGTTAVAGPLVRARRIANQIQSRQQSRQDRARAKARSDSRRAIELVIVAGVLALLGALALITALVQNMRRPLDALVSATHDLAAGQLDRQVQPQGPRELQALGQAFNAMGGDLAEARRRLEEQRQRLAVTIESLGDGLLVTEPGSTRIAAINPRAAVLVPELPVGERTDDPGSPLPPLAEAIASEQIVAHGDRTLAVTAAALGARAGSGVVWTVRDVSERARLERAKSDFVATASHELRSPLTSIKGFVELLAAQPGTMTARQQEFVEIILRSTDRLVELVNDLLDVARIEADYVEINRRPIDIGEAIREVAELMGPRIEERRQRLSVHVGPNLPLALADAARVRQIIANLLTNAHLYTPDGGRIAVSAEADRAWVQIVVADSGIGMTERDVEHVFERFYRGAGDGRKAPGTGLGLSIVKSLVDLHEGEISLSTEPGRGTTFTVRLPAAVAPRDPAHPLEAIRGRRVLVVDDEPEVAQLIADQLAAQQVQVTIASDGPRALELLAAEPFDAVTLDVMMPGLDGFAVLARLRADPELRSIPIVFVSVFSGQQELAGEWTVSKPIDADELRNVLDAAVRAGRSRVLVVGREELRPSLEPALDELGIEHEWELTGAAAARACQERRFEVALVDIGIRSPQAVLQALDLRGRRRRRAVILFSDGATEVPAGIGRLGMEVVPVSEAARALLVALQEDAQRAPGTA